MGKKSKRLTGKAKELVQNDRGIVFTVRHFKKPKKNLAPKTTIHGKIEEDDKIKNSKVDVAQITKIFLRGDRGDSPMRPFVKRGSGKNLCHLSKVGEIVK